MPIFAENCRAWIHGPVYPEVYDLFRDFKYNPIDDARFALLEGTEDALTDDEKRVIDLVVYTLVCMVEKYWRRLRIMRSRVWRREMGMETAFLPVSFCRKSGL